MSGLGRRQRIMPVAAGQAAHAVQPEVLRDGSLLFRFASRPGDCQWVCYG